MLVTFRSHDYWGGYPQNLAACCLWLCKLAEAHGMAVGQVMCVSHSAHIYVERDGAAAHAKIEAHRGAGIRWDQRSSWRVSKMHDNGPIGGPITVRSLRAEALTPDGSEVIATYEAKTPETLLRRIAESGLVTETGAALWLGREVERVWRNRT